jgi:hypothetical protein
MNRSATARLLSVVAASSVVFFGSDVNATLIPKPFNSITSSPPSLSTFSSISIANNGAPLGSRVYFSTLDLTNNDLIVHATNEATALANYANVFDMVRSGFDHGDWLGTGITSSKAAADHAGGYECTAVGVILNDDGSGLNADGSGHPLWGGAGSLLGSFDGDSALTQYDVIIKYTFFGDTLLRGFVDGTDLTTVQASKLSALTGWLNGEFNYTGGAVSTLDVLETQRTLAYESRYPINTPVPDPPPPLPQPSALVLAIISLLGLAVYSRRSA